MNESDPVPFNITLDEYLELALGPKHPSLSIVLPITIIYIVIFVTGVVGNVAVCIVIVRNASMRTATNYYLFSLAVSDLTLLILGVPNDIGVYWQQYPWTLGVTLCKLRALVSEMTSYTSVLTIVAFSMERYLAICHPLHSYTMSNLHRAVKIIAVLWIVSLISAAPFAIFTKVSYVEYPPGSGHYALESAFCAMMKEDIPENWPIYELSSFVFFIIPMFAIAMLYILMGFKIRSSNRQKLGHTFSIRRDHRQWDARTRNIIRMLATVVMAFFICWAPFHAQRLIYIYAEDSPHFKEINEWMYYITGILYYISSTVNPILYSVMSTRYRTAFRKTLCHCLPLSPGDSDTLSRNDRNNTSSGRNGLSSRRMTARQPTFKHNDISRKATFREENEEIETLVCPALGDASRTSEILVVVDPMSNGKAKTFVTRL